MPRTGSHDDEARRFLTYLKDQKLSVLSKDDLLFSYSVYRAQLKPSTKEYNLHNLLQSLKRIKAIKCWRDQDIEWIPGTIVQDIWPVFAEHRVESTFDGREIAESQGKKGRNFPQNGYSKSLASAKDKRHVFYERGVRRSDFDQVDSDEEIVWSGKGKMDVGPSSNMGRGKKPGMIEGREGSPSPQQDSEERYNSRSVRNRSAPHQYLILQELFEKTNIEERGSSLVKTQRSTSSDAGRDGVYGNTEGGSREKLVGTSGFYSNSSKPGAQKYLRGGHNGLMSGRDRNLNDRQKFSVNYGANASSISFDDKGYKVHSLGSSRCTVRGSEKCSQYGHNRKQPTSKGMSEHFEVKADCTGTLKTTSHAYSAGVEGFARDGINGFHEGDLSNDTNRVAWVSGQDGGIGNPEYHGQCFGNASAGNHKQHAKYNRTAHAANSVDSDQVGKPQIPHKDEGKGPSEKWSEEPKNRDDGGGRWGRNWMATQEMDEKDLFVSQPFSPNHERPQTIAVGGAETAVVSVVNNGSNPVNLLQIRLLYAKPKGSFSLALVASTELPKAVPSNIAEADSTSKKRSSFHDGIPLLIPSTGPNNPAVSSKKISSLTSFGALPGGPWSLAPGSHLSVRLACTAKDMGLHKAVILFDFGDQKVVRYATAMAEDEVAKELAPIETYSRLPRPKFRRINKFIRGKPPPVPGFSKPLDKYPIPADVRTAIMKDASLPVFSCGLSIESYPEYFSCLMYAEELQMEADIRAYDMQNVTMQCDRLGYIILRVPGLLERRPSVIYRDEIFVRTSGSKEKEYQGYVYKVQAEEVFLKFNGSFHAAFIPNRHYDVRFSYSRITIRRALQAIHASRNLPENFLFPHKLPPAAMCDPHDSFSPFNRALNEEQKIAVQEILKRVGSPPYLIYGPPGTGKTVTVVESILQILRYKPDARVLACAPSNSASDILLERLKDRVQVMEMLRLNAYTRPLEDVSSEVRPYCHSEGSFFCCPSQEKLLKYKVVVSTYWSAAMLEAQDVRPGHFSHIFLDESGQGMEPEALVAVANIASPETVVILAGDHHQLGPVIRSPVAEKFGLGKSFLERLSSLPLYRRSQEEGKISQFDRTVVTKLIKNYRSHPAILDLPSRLFYDGELIACAPVEMRLSLCGWEELPNKNFPILFIGIEGRDEREGKSPSWFNAQEASKVIEIVRKLKEHKQNRVSDKDIGIISPYNQQVNKIRAALASKNMKEIKVGSVEQFQGQEKRVIIISTVRSSKEFVEIDQHHNIGFLKNPKRFNVAITRAKALLVIVGNPYVLCQDEHWDALLRYCILQKSNIGCSPPPEENALDARLFCKCMDELFPTEVVKNEDSDWPFSTAAVVETQWADGTC